MSSFDGRGEFNSAFGPETVDLLQRQELLWTGLCVVLTVCVELLPLCLGMSAVR